MNTPDDRQAEPPTIADTGRRMCGRPRHTASRLTRRPHDERNTTATARRQPVPPDTRASLIEWHTMNEPEYTLAWQQLCAWTTWLTGRYRLTLEERLPACWPQHPELIEELWALRAWRTEAYAPESTGQSAVYWHQALITFLGHITTWWAAGCRAGHTTPHTDADPEQAHAWANADPLVGVPQPLRPPASIPTDPTHEPGIITMPHLNTLTTAQMQALTDAGLARPRHHTITALTYYDGSWWAYAPPEQRHTDAPTSTAADTAWFRTDNGDLACDPPSAVRNLTPATSSDYE